MSEKENVNETLVQEEKKCECGCKCDKMDVNTAINVLIQGVEIAQKKGVYTLGDAKLIATAIESLKSE